ncbi:MAG: hypothetical protein LBV19_08650 [Streptococcaceae bacterium]|jgi:hypothetical protein|nr:hypothetical protein [Streptococcaceae bacterium]
MTDFIRKQGISRVVLSIVYFLIFVAAAIFAVRMLQAYWQSLFGSGGRKTSGFIGQTIIFVVVLLALVGIGKLWSLYNERLDEDQAMEIEVQKALKPAISSKVQEELPISSFDEPARPSQAKRASKSDLLFSEGKALGRSRAYSQSFESETPIEKLQKIEHVHTGVQTNFSSSSESEKLRLQEISEQSMADHRNSVLYSEQYSAQESEQISAQDSLLIDEQNSWRISEQNSEQNSLQNSAHNSEQVSERIFGKISEKNSQSLSERERAQLLDSLSQSEAARQTALSQEFEWQTSQSQSVSAQLYWRQSASLRNSQQASEQYQEFLSDSSSQSYQIHLESLRQAQEQWHSLEQSDEVLLSDSQKVQAIVPPESVSTISSHSIESEAPPAEDNEFDLIIKRIEQLLEETN